MSEIEVIKAAATTLDEALALDWNHFTVSDEAKLWLLGQVWGESRFGSTPDWGASNNWGAIQYHLGDGKFIEHADHDAAGNPHVWKFQAYDSQFDAARDWLRVLLKDKRDVAAALAGDSSFALAVAMKAHGYYTGINVDTDGDGIPGTTHDRVLAYSQLIDNGAAVVRKKLAIANGEPDDVTVAQTALQTLGLYDGVVDGIDGPKTKAAIVAFQGGHGLAPDGIIGPITLTALKEVTTEASREAPTQPELVQPIVHPEIDFPTFDIHLDEHDE